MISQCLLDQPWRMEHPASDPVSNRMEGPTRMIVLRLLHMWSLVLTLKSMYTQVTHTPMHVK